MIRQWIGLAVLAVSWQLGLDYYQPARMVAWGFCVILGAWLMAGSPLRLPGRQERLVAMAILVAAAWGIPWPDRVSPLLLAVGLALQLLPIPGRWPLPLGHGAMSAGIVLLAQSCAVRWYIAATARSHTLPAPLAWVLSTVASLLGMDAAAAPESVAVRSFRATYDFSASWGLLVDPATVAFFAGGLVLLATTVCHGVPRERRWRAWCRDAGVLALAVSVWAPFRAGLLIAVFVQRAIRVDPADRLNLMNQFFNPWVSLVLLVPLTALAWWLIRPRAGGTAQGGESEDPQAREPLQHVSAEPPWRQRAASLGLFAAALGIAAFAMHWSPAGQRLAGRVMVVERHSTWERSDRAYDTHSFGHDPSYSYSGIYRYCDQFFAMSRLLESDPINDTKLRECDVLVIKCPTASYAEDEVEAIVRFVERGGGLLLIGEHTDRTIQAPYLNAVAGKFGFKFRYDTLFRIGDPYVQPYCPPRGAHPAVQHVPPMWFAVSCSIDPGWSWGEAVLRETGLWSLPADYHIGNFFSEPAYRDDARYGAFIQAWATTHGRGRVMAWTDSTIFSNFSTFEPGKPELMLGMLEWLNRRSILDGRWARYASLFLLGLTALALAGGGMLLGRNGPSPWLGALAAALLGWALGSEAAGSGHRSSMPPPPRRSEAEAMPEVILDRTASTVPLARGGFTQRTGLGYGLLEEWIPRLGYATRRARDSAALQGDALVILCPTQSVSDEFLDGVQRYVEAGGKLLVVDSPGSVGSTANRLLWPFGMSVSHAASRGGVLALSDGWPAFPVDAACQINGGTPFLWVDGTPTGARAPFGQGWVIAVGCGTAINDAALGDHWMRDADADVLQHSDLLFALVRGLVTGEAVVQPPPRAGQPGKPHAKPVGPRPRIRAPAAKP